MNRHLPLAVAAFVLVVVALWQAAAPPADGGTGAGARHTEAPAVVALARPASLKFAVVGDAGDGGQPQYDVGRQMWASRSAFPFEFVLALGDNMYGRQEPQDFVTKFEKPYQSLL